MKTSIGLAFSQARKPKPDEITTCPCAECRELAVFFGQFDPSTATIDDLREHETLLVHGTSIAFRYFLPFFLELSIRDLSKAGAIPGLVLCSIAADFKHLDRIGLLSQQEVECLESYFDLLVERGECEPEELCDAQKTLSKLDKRFSNG